MTQLYELEMRWIYALQEIRGPFVDRFFEFFAFFDRPEFLFLLIPTVWVGYHWKEGMRLFYIVALSGLLNYALKTIFQSPRPFFLDPAVAVMHVTGYGFPSGAAQIAVLLPGIFLTYFKKPWAWVVALNFWFWLSLSRVYLGVHFPSDLLGGWVVGFFLLVSFIYARPPFEKALLSMSVFSQFLISQLLPLCWWVLLPSFSSWSICPFAMGVGFGYFIARHHKWLISTPKQIQEFLYRSLLGVGGLFALQFLLHAVLPFSPVFVGVRFFLLGLWLSCGSAGVWRLSVSKTR